MQGLNMALPLLHACIHACIYTYIYIMIGNEQGVTRLCLQPNRQNGKLHFHLINPFGSTPLNAQMA